MKNRWKIDKTSIFGRFLVVLWSGWIFCTVDFWSIFGRFLVVFWSFFCSFFGRLLLPVPRLVKFYGSFRDRFSGRVDLRKFWAGVGRFLSLWLFWIFFFRDSAPLLIRLLPASLQNGVRSFSVGLEIWTKKNTNHGTCVCKKGKENNHNPLAVVGVWQLNSKNMRTVFWLGGNAAVVLRLAAVFRKADSCSERRKNTCDLSEKACARHLAWTAGKESLSLLGANGVWGCSLAGCWEPLQIMARYNWTLCWQQTLKIAPSHLSMFWQGKVTHVFPRRLRVHPPTDETTPPGKLRDNNSSKALLVDLIRSPQGCFAFPWFPHPSTNVFFWCLTFTWFPRPIAEVLSQIQQRRCSWASRHAVVQQVLERAVWTETTSEFVHVASLGPCKVYRVFFCRQTNGSVGQAGGVVTSVVMNPWAE